MERGDYLAPPTLAEKLAACRTHLERSIKWKGEKLGILEMRQHYGPYFAGLANIKSFRSRLVVSENVQEIGQILKEIELNYSNSNSLTFV
jgi:tRNA-dihydrouridine synthase